MPIDGDAGLSWGICKLPKMPMASPLPTLAIRSAKLGARVPDASRLLDIDAGRYAPVQAEANRHVPCRRLPSRTMLATETEPIHAGTYGDVLVTMPLVLYIPACVRRYGTAPTDR